MVVRRMVFLKQTRMVFLKQTLKSRPSSKVPDVAPRVFGIPERDCSFWCSYMKTPSELDTVTQEAKQLLLHVQSSMLDMLR
jgi:hypothetical protein